MLKNHAVAAALKIKANAVESVKAKKAVTVALKQHKTAVAIAHKMKKILTINIPIRYGKRKRTSGDD